MIYLIGFGFGIIICIPVWLIIQSCIISDMKCQVEALKNRIIRLEETKKDLEGKAMLKDDEVIQYSDLLLKLKNKLTSANLEIETAKAFCRDYISDEF